MDAGGKGPDRVRQRSAWRRAAVITVIVFAVLLVIGGAQDGTERWHAQYGSSGTVGTLRLDKRVTHSVGKPPPIEKWTGTFIPDDGGLRRRVTLAESLPGGDDAGRPGLQVRVRLADRDSDEVYLESRSRAFTNWLEGVAVLVVGFAILGGVALWRATRRRQGEHA